MVILKCKILSLWTISFLMLTSVNSERTKDKMYEPIVGAVACFRRLNGTHQFGCSSHRSGNVGVIHIVQGEEDLDWLLHDAPAEPYTAVIRPEMFTRKVMLQFKHSDNVNGVILIHNSTSAPTNFTHEDTCPNRYSGLSSFTSQLCTDQTPWNPHGTGLMQVDWGFPIFHVKDPDSIQKISDCFNKHNTKLENHLVQSLCAIETSAYMYAAVDSKTCIRRSTMVTNFNPVRFCDPLGDRNVWSTLFPLSREPQENASYIVVAAQMDAASMFDGVTPGATSPVTGIVTLLTTASILSSMFKNHTELHSKNVLFLLLNGEAYDYVGSSRLAWDMVRKAFPISHDQLFAFIELGQLKPSSGKVYIHKYSEKLKYFVEIMKKEGEKVNLKFVDSNAATIPPASFQIFSKHNKDLPGIIFADFDTQFSNNYYHSIFDTAAAINYKYANGSELNNDSIQMQLFNISTALANGLAIAIANGSINKSGMEGNSNITAAVVDELLHCYLESSDCPIFRAATSPGRRASPSPPALYVGVSVWQNVATTLTAQALAYLTGDALNRSEVECHPSSEDDFLYQYLWIKGPVTSSNNSEQGVCYRSTYNYTIAVSPAFEIEDYDWASGVYSTWTESIWREFSVRIFLRPSRQHEIATLSAGIVVLVVSFIVVHFTTSRSNTLFCNTAGGNTLVAGC